MVVDRVSAYQDCYSVKLDHKEWHLSCFEFGNSISAGVDILSPYDEAAFGRNEIIGAQFDMQVNGIKAA
ncbi:hypothetical protein G9A89_015499 [Geosiphon pyriformis]|nr:hypothetical protein G9A89_015499 [Geosiphon pyriformis]